MKTECMKRGWKCAAVAVLVVAGLGIVVMVLWNWLTPVLFGWREIGYWQALGVLALSKILFGGLRGCGGCHGHRRHGLAERWEQMTPEERERFKTGMRGCCGSDDAADGDAERKPA